MYIHRAYEAMKRNGQIMGIKIAFVQYYSYLTHSHISRATKNENTTKVQNVQR